MIIIALVVQLAWVVHDRGPRRRCIYFALRRGDCLSIKKEKKFMVSRGIKNGKKERKGGPGMTWFIDCIG